MVALHKVSICPTVTAYDLPAFGRQIENISPFSKRIHVDLMDGIFAPTTSPSIRDIWLPPTPLVDVHLMFQEPHKVLDELIHLKPHMVIIHNEAHVHHMHFVAELHRHGIKAGLALLPQTPLEYSYQIMHSFDHVLIFSGKLGHHGGQANLDLLQRVEKIRAHHIEAEIGWDGGINEHNAKELVDAGIEVLNVGGYIQNASDPKAAYATLEAIVSPK